MTHDEMSQTGFRNILVATDFSPHSQAALKQAVWLARRNGARITLVHSLPNLRTLVENASYQGKVDFLYGEGSDFHREVQRESATKMQQLIADVNSTPQEVATVTLLGSSDRQITRLVQQGQFDLVIAGTRGLANWKQFFVGSTAKRLIRNCPASLWIVKGEDVKPPTAVLAATDFSDVSRKAVLAALWIAEQASAPFHLLHVIDLMDAPEEILTRIPDGGSVRREINEQAKLRLDGFVESLNKDAAKIQKHLSFGTPWQEVGRLAKHLQIDLIAMGTIGRSGFTGVLLGNTAERILDSCDCSIFTVKPADSCHPSHPVLDRSIQVRTTTEEQRILQNSMTTDATDAKTDCAADGFDNKGNQLSCYIT